MSSMNENFPIPRDSENDEVDIVETEDGAVVFLASSMKTSSLEC
jgi:hypothetical protein